MIIPASGDNSFRRPFNHPAVRLGGVHSAGEIQVQAGPLDRLSAGWAGPPGSLYAPWLRCFKRLRP